MMRSKISIVILVVISLVSSCGADDKAQGILDGAIDRIEDASEDWQAVLADTREKLIEAGYSALAHEVTDILNRAVGDLGIELRCSFDYFRESIGNDLRRIVAIRKKETFEARPAFCEPTPKTVDLNLPPDRRTYISISGYNLSRDVVTASLESATGSSTDISYSIDDPSSYLLTVNLSAIQLDANSRRIVFLLGAPGSRKEERSIAVTQPVATPKPLYILASVRISGTFTLHDIDNESRDEHRAIPVDTLVNVPLTIGASYHFENCLDQEVQTYFDATLTLDKTTGTVNASVVGQYYENANACGPRDFHDSMDRTFPISPGEERQFQHRFQDDDGWVQYDLRFTNASQETIMTVG